MVERRSWLRVCALLLGVALLAAAQVAPAYAAAPNDEPENAVAITTLPFTAEQSTADASTNGADPDVTGAACPAEVQATVWYRYTATRAGAVRLDTAASDYDTVLAVFTPSAQGLELVACNNTASGRMQAREIIDAVAGATYLVMVGAAAGSAPATLGLTVEESPLAPLALSVKVQRATPLVGGTGEVQLRGTVTCSRPVAVELSGSVEQEGARTSVSRRVNCLGKPVTWTAVSRNRQGPVLRHGPAQATVVVQGFDEHDDAVAQVRRRLRLRGPRIAFARSVSDGGHDPFRTEIFTVAEDGSRLKRLTKNNVEDDHPAYSPDAQRVAFTSSRHGTASIYVMNADGSRVRRLTTGAKADATPDWSPDGKWIVFTRYFPKQRQSDVLRVRVADRATRRITRTPARELHPRWSPDGKLIAVAKRDDRRGRSGIAVVRPDGSGRRWLTRNPRSRAGLVDESPTWSPTSSHVAFSRETSQQASSIDTVRRTGRGVARLTGAGGAARLPSWGADGRLVFVLDGALAAVEADGRGLAAVTGAAGTPRPYRFPDWAGAVPD